MNNLQTSSSCEAKMYCLYETIWDGKCEYGSSRYITASGEEEILAEVHAQLSEWIGEDEAQEWTIENQKHQFEIGEREIQVTIEEVKDIYKYLQIGKARPKAEIIVRGGVVQDVRGIQNYTIIDYDNLEAEQRTKKS